MIVYHRKCLNKVSLRKVKVLAEAFFLSKLSKFWHPQKFVNGAPFPEFLFCYRYRI